VKRKVCMIGSIVPYQNAGPATYLEGLSKALAKMIDVSVITWGPNNKEYKKDGREIHVIKKTAGTSIRSVIKAKKNCDENEIIHVNHAKMVHISKILLKNPIVFTVHGYYAHEAVSRGEIIENSRKYKKMMNLEKTAYKHASELIAVDRRIYEYLIEKIPEKRECVHHIPNATDTIMFNPEVSPLVREHLQLGDRPVVLFLKGFYPKNGPHIPILAMRDIIKEVPDAILLMVGGGPLENELVTLVKNLDLGKNVIFTGPVSHTDAPYYYSSSDIVVVPSVRVSGVEEATSITMLEGMATGKPVVASNIGGLKETISPEKENRIGVLFEQGDARDMAKKTVHLLKNREERERMGKNAREFILKRHSWELNARRVAEIYNKIQ